MSSESSSTGRRPNRSPRFPSRGAQRNVVKAKTKRSHPPISADSEMPPPVSSWMSEGMTGITMLKLTLSSSTVISTTPMAARRTGGAVSLKLRASRFHPI